VLHRLNTPLDKSHASAFTTDNDDDVLDRISKPRLSRVFNLDAEYNRMLGMPRLKFVKLVLLLSPKRIRTAGYDILAQTRARGIVCLS